MARMRIREIMSIPMKIAAETDFGMQVLGEDR